MSNSTPLIAITLVICLFTFSLLFYYIFTERLWFKKLVWKLYRKTEITKSEFENFIYSFCDVLFKFSKKKVGALIVFEKFQDLQKYIKLGYEVHAKFFPEFLYNVFLNKESSMHDGGVIIRGLEIRSISSYFPITSDKNISNKFGSRHRAAMGITSKTDAIAFLVSESSGKILYSQGGQVFELNRDNISLLGREVKQLLSFLVEQ